MLVPSPLFPPRHRPPQMLLVYLIRARNNGLVNLEPKLDSIEAMEEEEEEAEEEEEEAAEAEEVHTGGLLLLPAIPPAAKTNTVASMVVTVTAGAGLIAKEMQGYHLAGLMTEMYNSDNKITHRHK